MIYGSQEDQDRVINGVEGGRDTGLLNEKQIGTVAEVKVSGKVVGRSATLWVIDEPESVSSTYDENILVGAGTDEEFVRREIERVAQVSRARFRRNLLDSVAAKALRYIRG